MEYISVKDNKSNQNILAHVILNEAKGLISDIAAQPGLILQFMGISEEKYDLCIQHVAKIFYTYFETGQMKLIVNASEKNLNGYALFFDHPDPNYARYCHKIFVYQPARRKGIGTELTKGILDESESLTLLCSPDLVPFYESCGMLFGGYYELPEDSENFRFTRGMYHGLAVMNSAGISGPAPVFFLNDNDIKDLLKIISSV